MGRFSLPTYIRTSVPPSGPSSQAWGPASQAWNLASQPASGFRLGWLGLRLGWMAQRGERTDGHTNKRTNERTDERKISPFYRTSSPIGAAALPPPMKTKEKVEQGKGTADHLMPLGYLLITCPWPWLLEPWNKEIGIASLPNSTTMVTRQSINRPNFHAILVIYMLKSMSINSLNHILNIHEQI